MSLGLPGLTWRALCGSRFQESSALLSVGTRDGTVLDSSSASLSPQSSSRISPRSLQMLRSPKLPEVLEEGSLDPRALYTGSQRRQGVPHRSSSTAVSLGGSAHASC